MDLGSASPTTISGGGSSPTESPSQFAEMKQLVVEKMVSVHVPNLVTSVCQGIVTPIIPIYARSLGASDAAIGLITSGIGLGRVVSSIPGSMLTQKFGLRMMMTVSMVIALVGVGIAMIAVTQWMLGAAAIAWGTSIGLYFIARHPYLAVAVGKGQRGRLMALVGGMNRWGFVLGPVIGGVAIDAVGPRLAWTGQAPLALCAAACTWWSEDVKQCDAKVRAAEEEGHKLREETLRAAGKEHASEGQHLMTILHEHGRRLAVLGVFASTILGMRMNRRMMLPLAAMNNGLPATYVGLIVSASFVTDATLFWVGGWIMDKFGRRMAQVPTSALLGLAFFGLAFTYDVPTLLLSAFLFGLAETTGSGVLLTMIADHTPKDAGVVYMGLLRTAQDCGQMLWPLVLGVLTTTVSFRASCIFMGVVGILNAFWALYMIPETHDVKKGAASGTSGVKAASSETGDTKSSRVEVAVDVIEPMDVEEDRNAELERELQLSICSAPSGCS